jgi:5-methylthioadenosine/S-adenosylhomocysteine deaminase
MKVVREGLYLALAAALTAAACGTDEQNVETGQATSELSGARSYLIRNAGLVLTMDPNIGVGQLGELRDADVLMVGDHIQAVGHNLSAHGAKVIDGTGKIVMPGFVDTHDHLWQSLIRGCATDENVNGWLVRCVFPFNTAPFTEFDAYAGVRLSTTGLIDTGVTTVVDWSHSFNPGFVRGNLRALNDSGMRYAFAMFAQAPDGSDALAAKAQYIDPNPLGTLQLAAHPGPFTVAQLQVMTDLAKQTHLKLHVHLLENISQVDEHPMDLLQAAGAFDLGRDLFTAHDCHLSDSDIASLQAIGASTSHQPLSNMRLASGIMRVPEVQSAGIRIGLGLDGGTNDTADMFNNMRAAVGLQRAKSLDSHGTPTVADVLRMATMGGAEVLDQDDKIGSLTPGKQADVIVIDPNALNWSPQLDQVAQIVFNGQPQNVEWTFVAGRALKANGKLVGVNMPQLLEDAQTAVDTHIAPAILP